MSVYTSKTEQKEFQVEIQSNRILSNGKLINAALSKNNTVHALTCDNRAFNVYIKKQDDLLYEVWIKHHVIVVKLETEVTKILNQLSPKENLLNQTSHVKAPMPGLIKTIEVKEGQSVDIGNGLIVLEAMKMENEIRSSVCGTVKKIIVEKSQTVEKNQLLLIIEPKQNE